MADNVGVNRKRKLMHVLLNLFYIKKKKKSQSACKNNKIN